MPSAGRGNLASRRDFVTSLLSARSAGPRDRPANCGLSIIMPLMAFAAFCINIFIDNRTMAYQEPIAVAQHAFPDRVRMALSAANDSNDTAIATPGRVTTAAFSAA